MGQLFLWTNKISDTSREEFVARFGFEIPEPLLELHENLPEEFLDFLGYFRFDDIISESQRPPSMMPGLVPFAEEGDGDCYCFYLPWKDQNGHVPIGMWLHETNHFLPISNNMMTFLVWWITKETLDGMGGEDWDEMRKILELLRGSCGMDDYNFLVAPPNSAIAWHENLLQTDPQAPFSLTYLAASQYALHGVETSLEMLQMAEESMPGFGASTLWQARLLAMTGQLSAAHEAYWRHLRTPMFSNGYHYWWHSGDLQVPETSEMEAIQFFHQAEVKPPREIMRRAKVQFLQDHDPHDYRDRLKLSMLLEQQRDYKGALVELENAFFIQGWDDAVAQEILERLLCIYPEQQRLREAEQCRRALAKLRAGGMTL
jgi:hypothetical protein